MKWSATEQEIQSNQKLHLKTEMKANVDEHVPECTS